MAQGLKARAGCPVLTALLMTGSMTRGRSRRRGAIDCIDQQCWAARVRGSMEGAGGHQWVVINGNEATCAGPGLSLATSLCSVQLSAVINSGQATSKPERSRVPQASPDKMVKDVGPVWPQRCLPWHATPCQCMSWCAVTCHARRPSLHCPAPASSQPQDASCSSTASQAPQYRHSCPAGSRH